MEFYHKTHFLFCFRERGREGRLIRMIADTRNQVNGVKVGLGVDEDTALVVTDVGTNLEKGEVCSLEYQSISKYKHRHTHSPRTDTRRPLFINVLERYHTE